MHMVCTITEYKYRQLPVWFKLLTHREIMWKYSYNEKINRKMKQTCTNNCNWNHPSTGNYHLNGTASSNMVYTKNNSPECVRWWWATADERGSDSLHSVVAVWPAHVAHLSTTVHRRAAIGTQLNVCWRDMNTDAVQQPEVHNNRRQITKHLLAVLISVCKETIV